MYRIPSSRKKKPKSHHLNLVPILDSFLTLMFFLLLSGTVMHYYKISSDVPIVSNQTPPPNKVPPQNLTVQVNSDQMVILMGLPSTVYKTIPNIPRKASSGVQPASVATQATEHDLEALRIQLVEIKKKAPKERTLLLEVMEDGISYEQIIKIMDIARNIRPTDEPIINDNKPEQSLFEDIIFTNLKS